MLKKKWILLVVILIGGVILFPRMDPDKYLTSFIYKKMNETPGLLVINPTKVQSYGNYVGVRVEYEVNNQQFKPVEHWFIKDRSRIQQLPASNLSKWEGYIFLVKDGLYSWKVIE